MRPRKADAVESTAIAASWRVFPCAIRERNSSCCSKDGVRGLVELTSASVGAAQARSPPRNDDDPLSRAVPAAFSSACGPKTLRALPKQDGEVTPRSERCQASTDDETHRAR